MLILTRISEAITKIAHNGRHEYTIYESFNYYADIVSVDTLFSVIVLSPFT